MTRLFQTTKTYAAALLLGLAIAAVAPEAAAQGTSADVLFAEGNKAYDDSDFALAQKKYAEAFALKPTYDIAANLGATELKLAKFAEAANHLAFAVRNFPPSGDAKKKSGAERLYGEARQKVGALDIVAPAGAEVLVDGVSRGKAPLIDPVYVDPGEHQIEARDGDKVGKASGRVQASESTQVSVKIEGSVTPPPPVTPPPGGEQAGEGPPLWPGIVLAAAGGVGIGVGIGLFAAGGSADSDADAIAAELAKDDTTKCGENPTGPLADKCTEGADKQSSAHSLGIGGGVAMGIGGALAAGSVVYLIWAATSDSPDQSATFQPLVSPGFAGGAFSGSF